MFPKSMLRWQLRKKIYWKFDEIPWGESFASNQEMSPELATRLKSCDGEIPRHIAIIMDGNGRWAAQKSLPRIAGHRAGVKAVRSTIKLCMDYGIEYLTLFAFSSENWRRPEKEVSLLMDLFITSLRDETEVLHKNNVKIKVIGDRAAFSEKLQKQIKHAEEMTADNSGLTLLIAANYGGKWDICEAVRKLAKEVEQGNLDSSDLTIEHINERTSLAEYPEPDLFIRTGGEHRISNFLLWQLAYTELYFTDVLWPDFNQHELDSALKDFTCRQRRFGQTGEQVEKLQGA
jgi:undecaprenyl diphosphate synthase